jgi:hypothetical protein
MRGFGTPDPLERVNSIKLHPFQGKVTKLQKYGKQEYSIY